MDDAYAYVFTFGVLSITCFKMSRYIVEDILIDICTQRNFIPQYVAYFSS